MNEERWKEIKLQIKSTLEVEDEYTEELDPGEADVLEFVGPSGKMKVKFVTRPKFLDKKTTYSGRAAAGEKVDYVYSEDEVVSHMEVYNWLDTIDNWQKMEGESLF